jgi:hypothetical protein
MPEASVTFAWCFSHGQLHRFRLSDQYPDGAWCTAKWMPLDGATEEEALRDKQARFDDAQFDHHLPHEKQLAVIEACAARRREERTDG